MDENTQETTEQVSEENAQTEVQAETGDAHTEAQNDGLVGKDDSKGDDEAITNNPLPDGLDDSLYDAETRTFKEQGVIDRIKKDQEEIAKFRKQANDMRRKLSKGVDAPDKVEDYATDYMYDERYDIAMADEESVASKHVKGALKEIDQFAFEHGMSKEACKDLKNMYMKYAENVQILDTRTDEQRAKARQEYIAKQREALGDDADTIVKENVKFVKEYNLFSKEEKEMLLKGMDNSATANTLVRKIRTLFGDNTSADIPMRENIVTGLADDNSLAREYYDTKTSDNRRWQILQQRRDAGRTGGLPMPD